MKRSALKSLALILILSLLTCSLPGVSVAETSTVRTLSMRTLLSGNLAHRSGLTVLTRQAGRTKAISAPSGASAKRYSSVSIDVKIVPASQEALDDLCCCYSSSKLAFQSASYTVSKSYLTVRFNFTAEGSPGDTSIKFYSGSKKSVKDYTNVEIKPIPVVSVALNTYGAAMTAGDKLQLTATVLPGNASSQSVRWTSGNRSVATVSSTGLVTAVKAGSTSIIATSASGGKRATCCVKVAKPGATPSPSPMPSATPTPVEDTTVYRALLIGNEAYSTRLRGPYNDLTAMNAVLARSSLSGKTYTGNITSLRDQKKAQVLSNIAAFAKKGIDSNDVTLFYYSGHGAQGSLTESGTGLWCVDNKLLSVTELKTALDAIPGTVVVILDSCFSGMFVGKSTNTASGESFDDKVMSAFTGPLKSKGLTTSKYHVITACRKGETSVSVGYTASGSTTYVGLSTYFLAIAGGYDLFKPSDTTFYGDSLPQDGIATFGEVFTFADTYVDQFVASYNSSQLTQDMQYYTTNIGFPLFGRT
jgi:hypothetical protein